MTTKQTFWRTFFAVALMLLTMPASVWADSTFGGGSGTQADPYKIYNPSHFVQLSDEVKAGNTFEGVYFKMLNSVNFAMWGKIPSIGGQYYTENNYTGIRRFCGYFLGNNCTLYNVTIEENPDHVGIFGYLGYGGYVSDLTIDGNSTFTGIGNVGAIAGYADNNSVISNCKVGANVVVQVHSDASGSSYKPSCFGGIVGATSGSVWGCVSKATVSVNSICKATSLGGIAGDVYSGAKVENNYFLGTVDGVNTVGDIAGKNIGTVNNCYYHCATRHGGINGADTDGAQWMGTVAWGEGVSGSLPSATYNDNGTDYFATGKYMLLTLDYNAPDGYLLDGDAAFKANDVDIAETERAGNPYYEFNMPGEDVTINFNGELKRDIAYSPWVQITIPALQYTGEELTPDVQVTDIKDGANEPLVAGQDYNLTLPGEIIAAGEYTATLTGIGDYAGTVDVQFIVEPAESEVRIVTAPTAIEGLVYNGKAQTLVTPGEAENGTVVYKLDDGEYGTELPKATAAGTYTIYYKAYSDGNHLYTAEQSLTAQIAELEGTWEGEGTAEAPYLIASVSDMHLIAINRDNMDYTGVCFSLIADLDYTDTEYSILGVVSNRFKGNFNGNGHVITNLVLNRPNDNQVAMFGVVDDSSVITNIHLGDGCSFTGAKCVGGIASLSTGTITNCTTSSGVTIKADTEGGGIVGCSIGSVEGCVNRATVTATTYQAGGIAGSAYSSSGDLSYLSNNLNLGRVSSNNLCGGVAGYDFGGDYNNNYYAGQCTAQGIGGRDISGKAMRGYSIGGGNNVNVALAEGATVGVAFDGLVYAGNEQQVLLTLSLAGANGTSSQATFVASSGELIDNGDGTWTLTMADSDVVISAEGAPGVFGDVNGDGQVTVNDVTCVYNIILGTATDFAEAADINGDGQVTVNDVTAIYNIILGN